ncbi:hypothetical protein M3Y95_00678700 [Aphelenchoides besseyi]|nr:hypothetical protein M3Y95_00678700 [Aphelenchoides besseyi]
MSEGTLSGRRVFWCDSNQGRYGAYCPRPTDPDDHVYCCSYYYIGGADLPSCCRYPIHTGLFYALIFCAVISLLLFVFLGCWFCPSSPLAKRVERNRELRRQNEQ